MTDVETAPKKLKRQRSIFNVVSWFLPSSRSSEEVRQERIDKLTEQLNQSLEVTNNLNARMFNSDWIKTDQAEMLQETARTVWSVIQKSNVCGESYKLLEVTVTKPTDLDKPYTLQLSIATMSEKAIPDVDIMSIWEVSGLRS